MITAHGRRGEFAQCLVDEGALVNDSGGGCNVTHQVQVLGRRFAEAANTSWLRGTTLTLEETVAVR